MPSSSPTKTKTMKELADSNLHYFGPKKLEALDEVELEELAKLMAVDPEKDVPASQTGRIAFVLTRKQARARASADRAPSPLGGPPSPPEPPEEDADGADDASSAAEAAAPEVVRTVFKKHHKIRVAAFNSLKLRLQMVGLEEQWMSLMRSFASFDVILVSEVPSEPSIKKLQDKRAYGMKRVLDTFSHQVAGKADSDHIDDLWQLVLSEPSGPGNPEIHAVFVKKPITVLPKKTTTNFNAGGVPLDHAPFCVVVHDDRFERTDDRTWAFTSVHFPPKSRSSDRDAQLRAFFRSYADSAEFRANTPFTEKGAKDAIQAVVNHVIAGDFNTYPADFALEKDGFSPPLIGESISTSAGGQSYDNFVLSDHTTRKFALSSHVLELASYHSPSKDEKGVSDHSPILLSIREQPRAKSH